jgi:hypothetical protein
MNVIKYFIPGIRIVSQQHGCWQNHVFENRLKFIVFFTEWETIFSIFHWRIFVYLGNRIDKITKCKIIKRPTEISYSISNRYNSINNFSWFAWTFFYAYVLCWTVNEKKKVFSIYTFSDLSRQVFGHISYYKLYFQIIFSTLPAILFERKQR